MTKWVAPVKVSGSQVGTVVTVRLKVVLAVPPLLECADGDHVSARRMCISHSHHAYRRITF